MTHPISLKSIERARRLGANVEVIEGWQGRQSEELCSLVQRCDALVTMLIDNVDASVIGAAASSPRCAVISNVAVGADNIDLDAARAKGLAICTTPGVLDAATADIAMFLLLAASRHTTEAERALRRGEDTSWQLDRFVGPGLEGKTLGLVGFGRIAQCVARRAQGFDMTVVHHTRHETGHTSWVSSLEELCEFADAVSVHVPLTRDTLGLLGRNHFDRIGPHGVLVNTSRGAVLDQRALVEALEAGSLGGAGIDVYVGEPHLQRDLGRAPRLTVLPHIGSATIATRAAMVDLAIDNVLEVLSGRRPVCQVTP